MPDGLRGWQVFVDLEFGGEWFAVSTLIFSLQCERAQPYLLTLYLLNA